MSKGSRRGRRNDRPDGAAAKNGAPASEAAKIEPASPEQEWALRSETNVDVTPINLTKNQASRLLSEVCDGREPAVRNVLIELGGRAVGPLPDVNEVRVSRKFNRPVLYLPRSMELPQREGMKVIAEKVPGGVLITYVPRTSGRNR